MSLDGGTRNSAVGRLVIREGADRLTATAGEEKSFSSLCRRFFPSIQLSLGRTSFLPSHAEITD